MSKFSLKKSTACQHNFKWEFRRLQKIIKALVFENAALCDTVAQIQEEILLAINQRRFLLRRLLHLQGLADQGNQLMSLSPRCSDFDLTKKKHPGKKTTEEPTCKKKTTDELIKESLLMKQELKRSASKPRRQVQAIPLDNMGRPVFPIRLGNLTVYSLGEIVNDRDAYHSETCLFPVGFCSTRVYNSFQNPSTKCLYTCKILDGGDNPRFEISPEDAADKCIVGKTASECHRGLLERVNKAAGIEIVRPVGRGPDFFGLTHPTILNLIQSSPGARRCVKYRLQKFEVCKTLRPAVVNDNMAATPPEALQS